MVFAACNSAVPTPAGNGFSLAPSESTLEVFQGGEVSSFVNLNRQAGFKDVVEMTFQDLPAGFSQEWTRDSANGDCSFVLKIDPSVAPGPRKLTIVGEAMGASARAASAGVSAQATATQTITINVGTATGSISTFAVSTNPSIVEVAQGGSATLALNLKNATNSAINIDLSGVNLPSGVGINFSVNNPVSVIASGSRSMSAQIVVRANAPLGTSTIRIKGKVGTIERTASISLTIKPAANLSFNMALSPTSKTVVQGLALGDFIPETSASITRLNGFSSNITMSAQNVPAGVTVQFAKTTLTTADASTAVNLAVPSSVAPGSYSLTIKATGGNVVKTASFAFEVLSGAEFLSASSVGTNQLDAGFGVGGLKIGEDFKQVVSLIRLNDGKFLVTGADQFGLPKTSRLNADGSLDTSYGVGGSVKYPTVQSTNGPSFLIPVSATLLSNGKLVVVGDRFNCDADGNCDPLVGVARVNADGTPDTSFGQGGIFNSNPVLKGRAIGAFPSGDKLVLLTATFNLGTPTGNGEVVRLTAGGNLDPDFDGDGRKGVDLGGATDVAIQDGNGKIFAAGGVLNTAQTKVARLSLEGVLDTTFDIDGKATVAGLIFKTVITGAGVVTGDLLTDSVNRIVLVGGVQGGGFGVVRLTQGGALDTSFDGDGKANVVPGNLSGGFASGVALQNGKIVVVGQALGSTSGFVDGGIDYGAARFNDNGSLDIGFGKDGKVAFGFEANNTSGIASGWIEFLSKVVSLPDGKLMAAGNKIQNSGGGLSMVRFNP